MGQDIDQPITVWEEMFLPSEIILRANDFSYTDASGMERQLISKVEVFNSAKNRPAVKPVPHSHWFWELAVGLCAAAALGFLRYRASKMQGGGSQIFRRIFGTAQAALGLFFGIMGTLLFFMCFFTSHDYTYNNSNVIFVNPLLLAAVPLGLIAAFCRDSAKFRKADFLLKTLWTYVFLGGLLTVVLRLLPGFYQQNQPTQALILPFAFVLSLIPGWLKKTVAEKRE
jgi:hypothetical protein